MKILFRKTNSKKSISQVQVPAMCLVNRKILTKIANENSIVIVCLLTAGFESRNLSSNFEVMTSSAGVIILLYGKAIQIITNLVDPKCVNWNSRDN